MTGKKKKRRLTSKDLEQAGEEEAGCPWSGLGRGGGLAWGAGWSSPSPGWAHSRGVCGAGGAWAWGLLSRSDKEWWWPERNAQLRQDTVVLRWCHWWWNLLPQFGDFAREQWGYEAGKVEKVWLLSLLRIEQRHPEDLGCGIRVPGLK